MFPKPSPSGRGSFGNTQLLLRQTEDLSGRPETLTAVWLASPSGRGSFGNTRNLVHQTEDLSGTSETPVIWVNEKRLFQFFYTRIVHQGLHLCDGRGIQLQQPLVWW